ncbi:TolC family protein [Dyadobacter psychrotolerans]|uniref:TolC family protein n=1 Tax=Dyadobacter psychrotolerans TaxID=2541721 RepID=A0A4R5DJ40_9BACT|nr:TolC family protein [Dyadobacter psychrotolerans]TDE11964.1 TolC family protein [Dyadobacter psychrotolerans]
MINKTIFLVLFSAAPMLVAAQKSAILDDYVEEGLTNNLSLQQESLEIKKAMEMIRQAKALFYPRLTFAPTYSYAAGGRRLNFPVGDLLNPAYKSLNELTGKNQFPTNIENVNELLAPTNFHDTKVAVQYSVYNPEIKYNYLIQKTLLSAQEAKKKVVENELRYNIETAYYQYLQSLEAVKIFENSGLSLNELVRLNKKLVANNTLTKDVVFSSEYEVSKLLQQKVEAENTNKVARAYFNFLINRELTSDILVDTMLINSGNIDFSLNALPGLTDQAVAGRQELKQLDLSIEASRQAVELQQKAASRPSLFVGGNVGFQGYGYTFKDQAYMVGQVGLQLDIFKGFEKKSKIQQAKIQTDLLLTKKTEVEKQIGLQTTQAYYDLLSATEAQKAAQDGLMNASQYFKIIDSRYRNGNVLLIEFIKAQNDIQTARLQQSINKYDVLIKKSILNKIISEP